MDLGVIRIFSKRSMIEMILLCIYYLLGIFMIVSVKHRDIALLGLVETSLFFEEKKCCLLQVFYRISEEQFKENEQRKGRSKLSLSEFLDIAAARHRTCIPTSTIPSIRRLSSSDDVKTHKETQRDGAGLHNNLWWRVVKI